MDIPAAAAAPWLVLGVASGIALVVLVALGVTVARHRHRNPRRPAGAAELPADGAQLPAGAYAHDDLPGFLESPPGSPTGTAPPRVGWPALSSASPPPTGDTSPTPASSAAGAQRSPAAVLLALTLATVLLVAAAAAVAVSHSVGTAARTARVDGGTPVIPRQSEPTTAAPSPGAPGAGDLADSSVPPGDDGAEAELTFRGVVLERHAVGVTATYPVLDLDWDGDRALAHLELPTFNCLRDQAPDDPVAAGCRRSLTEYADVVAGDLEVRRDGDRLIVSGVFPTYLRPNGTPPVWTGRRYELVVTAEPERRGPGWQPARGEVQLGADRAPTTGAEADRIRYGG